ncbi:MAG: nucleoside deaminase [Cyclobacteriaceae bacterium]|nr:nucleoside deaminase [Cyclobacteriaceae bacterium]MCH8517223.1 nucleoside deaminase [Cyclobacteriaceae bacterium]
MKKSIDFFKNSDYISQQMELLIAYARKKSSPFSAVVINPLIERSAFAVNTTSKDGPIHHAEMNALESYYQKYGKEDAADLILLSTAEPCPMCMAAIMWSKIPLVAYGVDISFLSKVMPQILISAQEVAKAMDRKTILAGGIKEEECQSLFRK